MLACVMHVWLAKQPPINQGLRQWLPSCVHNSSHRFSLSLSLSIYFLFLYISLVLHPSFAPAPAPRWPLNQSVSSIVYPSGTHPCNKHWSANNSLSDAGLEPVRNMAACGHAARRMKISTRHRRSEHHHTNNSTTAYRKCIIRYHTLSQMHK